MPMKIKLLHFIFKHNNSKINIYKKKIDTYTIYQFVQEVQ